MAGTERLQAGNARNDVVAEGDPAARLHAFDDADRAVIKHRIAPDEEGAGLPFRKLALQQRLVGGGNARMPVVHAFHVAAAFGAADGHGEFDGAAAGPRHVTGAYPAAQLGELGLLLPFGRDEEHISPVQRIDRLNRHVLGVARTDTDDQDVSHAVSHRATRIAGPVLPA